MRNIIGDALHEAPLPLSLDCTLVACEACKEQMWIDSGQRALMAEFEAAGLDYVMTCMGCRPGVRSDMEEVFIRDSHNAAETLRMMRGVPARCGLAVVTMAELAIIKREHPEVCVLGLRWD